MYVGDVYVYMVVGNFHHADLKVVLPKFHQHIKS